MLTDSHIHLYLKDFDADLDTIIQQALDKKINRFFLPNIDNSTLNQLLTVCENYKNICYPLIGLHPCSVKSDYIKQLDLLYSKMSETNFIGIGEIGIDLHWDKSFINEQKIAFSTQINWAKEQSLPIVIHSRNSFNEIYKILCQEKDDNLKGVFHCFSGEYKHAKKIIDLGFYLGIGGVLTFKNSHLPDLIKKIGLDNIILETDAPYLAPHPMRGRRNEPKFLHIIAEKVAEITNKNVDQVAKITNKNINDIFFT